MKVYQLLAERSPESDAKTGQTKRPHSSQALLLDLINADSHNLWKEIQQCRDLQLLLDTSTTILPYVEDAISKAIRIGKTELAKVMLFFAVFDRSYVNQIVLLKQLIRGNSLNDIRRIDPFFHGDESIFVNAVRSGNFELANLILDKTLKLNPIRILSPNLYSGRTESIRTVYQIIARGVDNWDMVSLKNRLDNMLRQEILRQLVFVAMNISAWAFGLFSFWNIVKHFILFQDMENLSIQALNIVNLYMVVRLDLRNREDLLAIVSGLLLSDHSQ